MVKTLLILLAAGLTACSGDTNLNQFFVSQAQQDSLDIAFARAEYQFDQGELDDALENIEKAYAINPENDKVATLYGYILLALAGIDPFQMTEALMDQGSASEAGLNLNEDNAAGTLDGLSFIVDVTEADLQKLGEVNTSSDFPDMDVIHPSSAPEARTAGVTQLQYVNKAIDVICPFIGEGLKIAGDPRHGADTCPVSDRGITLGSKGSFLWAFAHLTDALTFNKVLNYSTGAATPNVQKRSATASQATGTPATYLSLIAQVTTDIDAIFDVADANSQLNAVLNGLTATSEAFSAMAGIPESLSGSISTAVSSLRNGAGGAGESSVLKGQMNAGVSSQMSQSIQQMSDAGDLSGQELTDACADLESISGGQQQLPPACSP